MHFSKSKLHSASKSVNTLQIINSKLTRNATKQKKEKLQSYSTTDYIVNTLVSFHCRTAALRDMKHNQDVKTKTEMIVVTPQKPVSLFEI